MVVWMSSLSLSLFPSHLYINPPAPLIVSDPLCSTLKRLPPLSLPPFSVPSFSIFFQMAAFSYQHPPFLLDSVFFPTTPMKMVSGFMEEGNLTTSGFSHFSPNSEQPLHHDHLLNPAAADTLPGIHETKFFKQSSRAALSADNEPCVTQKLSTDSSMSVVDRLELGEQVTQKVPPMDKERKRKTSRDGSSITCAQSKDAREKKGKRAKKGHGVVVKDGEEEQTLKADVKKDQKKGCEEPPTGYIHVRARRGQATDSHSLAERVRREKISERMKLLQALVPGCDKVTGKALMLDEIINYVQSLQNQVEFLSMKLASVNPMFYDFGMDLDALMVRPERLSALTSPVLPSLQQCSHSQPPTAYAAADTTTTFSATNNYPVMDTAASLLFHQGQRLNHVFSQDNGSLLWDVDDQRHNKFINPSGLISNSNNNNLCSFH